MQALIKPGAIVFNGKTDKGIELTIRTPLSTDLKAMQEYINTISRERTFIHYQGEQLTLEEEQNYLDSHLKLMGEGKSLLLLVFHQDKLIGSGGIDMHTMTRRHIGELGMSIAKEYRGQGIGSLLLKHLIEEGSKKLTGLEIISLGVFSKNAVGIDLYKRFGFVEYGHLPNGTKLENAYDDLIFMFKAVFGGPCP